MKVAVTGHSSGIGQGIVERLQRDGHTVTGYSRLNGYDLSEDSTVFRILSEIADYDVLINSAYTADRGLAQVELLYAMFEVWRNNPTKTILSISSTASDGIALFPHLYAVHKAALDKACEQLVRIARCRIINVKPQYVDTPMTAWKTDGGKMSVSDVVETIVWTLGQPRHVLVSTITLRNAKM